MKRATCKNGPVQVKTSPMVLPSSFSPSLSLSYHPCHLQPGWQRRPGRTRNGRVSVNHSSQDEPCLVKSLPICHFGISLSPKNEASLKPGAALEDMPSTFGATGDLALQPLLDYRRLTRVLSCLTGGAKLLLCYPPLTLLTLLTTLVVVLPTKARAKQKVINASRKGER